MEALRVIELIAVIIAALAVAAAAIYLILLIRRWQRLLAQASRVLESDVRRTLGEIEAAAQRAQVTLGEVEATAQRSRDTLGKMDATLIPFALTVRRIEKWTAAVATEALVANALGPALGRLSGWLSGLRKGVSGVLMRRE